MKAFLAISILALVGISNVAQANSSEYSFVLRQERGVPQGCGGRSCHGPFEHDYTASGPGIKTIRVCDAQYMTVSDDGGFPLQGECIEFLGEQGQILAQFPNVQPEKPIDLTRVDGVMPQTRQQSLAETRQFFVDQVNASKQGPDHCAAQTARAVLQADNVDFKIDPTKSVAMWNWAETVGVWPREGCDGKKGHQCLAPYKVWDANFHNFADTDVLYDAATCKIIDAGFKFAPNFGHRRK